LAAHSGFQMNRDCRRSWPRDWGRTTVLEWTGQLRQMGRVDLNKLLDEQGKPEHKADG
jgi:hypothetical protein